MAQLGTKISDAELSALVKAEIFNCDAQAGSLLVNERVENLDFYLSKPFGNEVDGRSQVISSDVMEVVEWILPHLIRIFSSGDEVVSFLPEMERDIPSAKQATEYVNYIWMRDNPGFLTFYSWFKDALISKNGQVKIWWDDSARYKRESYYGLDDKAFALLVNNKNVEVSEHTEREEDVPQTSIDPATGQPVQTTVPQTVHDVIVTRKDDRGRVCIVPVPPEEFIISRYGRDIESARLVGHKRRRTLSSLVEDGYDVEVVNALSGDEVSVNVYAEEIARNTVENIQENTTTINPAMREVWVTECYLKVDVDGDGIAEMRKIVVAGEGYKMLSNEAWDTPRPFANLTPIPMPHRFYGLAVADIIKDLQIIKSTVLRQYLDNLYLANNQREEVLESAIVDPSEVLSSTPGSKIRVRQMGSIQPIVVPNIGQQALDGLEYLDSIRESRTGVSDRVQGLEDDTINPTLGGARIQMTAAMSKIELIARIFAETGVKDAFKLILHLVCQYQQKARVIELSGQWVPMDPASWNTDMSMQVSVGLGTGDKQQQLGNATVIGNMQEKVFPLGMVTPDNMMATAELALNAMGQKGADRFFTKPPPGAQQQKPDPKMVEVQAKTQLQAEKQKSDAALAQQGQQADMQLEVTKLGLDAKISQLEMQMKQQSDNFRIQLEAARDNQATQGKMQLAALEAHLQQQTAAIVAHINAAAKIEAARVTAKSDDGAAAYQREAQGEGAGA